MTPQAGALLVAFLVAHYLGDFTFLATERVHEAKARGGPLGPIAGHAAVHGVLIGAAGVFIVRPSWRLLSAAVAIEFVSHFLIDVGRARLGARVPPTQDPGNDAFWYVYGADQLAHLAVLVGLVALLV